MERRRAEQALLVILHVKRARTLIATQSAAVSSTLLMAGAFLVLVSFIREQNDAHGFWGGSAPGKRHRIERYQSYTHPAAGIAMKPGPIIEARAAFWMQLSPKECRKRLRVTQPVLHMLRHGGARGQPSIVSLLEPQQGHFDDALTGWQKVCLALYAMGSRAEVRVMAEDVFACAHSTMRSCLRQFTAACVAHLKSFYIKFTKELIDIAATQCGDEEGHLGCFGSLDGRKFPTRCVRARVCT